MWEGCENWGTEHRSRIHAQNHSLANMSHWQTNQSTSNAVQNRVLLVLFSTDNKLIKSEKLREQEEELKIYNLHEHTTDSKVIILSRKCAQPRGLSSHSVLVKCSFCLFDEPHQGLKFCSSQGKNTFFLTLSFQKKKERKRNFLIICQKHLWR